MAFYTPSRNEYGGEDYSGSIEGILILTAIFLVYYGSSWLCKKICKTESAVNYFFNIITHGPNLALLIFLLYHNPFKSFNNFMGMIGTMIVSSFIFWGVREVFINLTWKDIEATIKKSERSNLEKKL
ncbi:hypothetical protein [Limnohabitans sp. Rim8]|uniref:hypothetical protein n=1 Tax=Limnohabitans sp. Rim8 TaxID=1100718 RepID=UPI00330611F6